MSPTSPPDPDIPNEPPWKGWLDERLRSFRQKLAGLDSIPQLLILGVFSGLLTGSVILMFRAAIEWPLTWALPDGNAEGFESLSERLRFLLPLMGAIITALVLNRLSAENRRVGVSHVMERLSYHQGYMSLKGLLVQFFCGVATVTSGQSAGREGPAVHLGASVSSLLGQKLALPNNSIRMLVGCGTAAAISASFNTPIAGVIFAMEVVVMEYTIMGFMPIITAAVVGALVTQSVYGDEPAFIVPDFYLHSLWELPYVVALGLVIAVASAGFVQVVSRINGSVKTRLEWRLVAAGMLTGLAAMAVPEIMGIGYDTVDLAIAGNLGVGVLLLIGVVKLLVTATSIGLGMPSGVIGPALFVGACLGGAFGALAQYIMPTLASDAGLYAVLGMGAMMGALLQAPLAAITAIIELTRSPNIILPAMLCIICANAVASHYFRQRSLFQTQLQNQGMDYKAEPLTLALRRVSVGALMNRNFARCNREISLEQAGKILANQPHWLLIDAEQQPRVVMPAAELAKYLEERAEEIETIDLIKIPARRHDVTALPIQATLEEALARLDSTGVEALFIERTSAPMIKPVLGIVVRSDIESYYQIGRTHR